MKFLVLGAGSLLSDFLTSITTSVSAELSTGIMAGAGIVATLAAFGLGWKLYKKVTGART